MSPPRPEPKQPAKPAPTERPARTSTTERTARATVPAPKVATPEPKPAPPRAATTQAAAPNTTSTVVAPPPTVQQATVTPPRPLPIVPAAPTETPVAAPPPGPATAADVAPIFESYARAIEARDVAAIRRVYPGLTADQQRGFEQFFEAARKLDVTFRVASVEGSATIGGGAGERDLPVRELVRTRRTAARQLRRHAAPRRKRLAAASRCADGRSSAPHQNVRSIPNVYARFGRSPPRFNGKSVLSTMIVLRAGANLTPNEPSTMSSRTFGMFVGFSERRKGDS